MTWDDGDQEEFEASRKEQYIRRAEAAEARVMELEQEIETLRARSVSLHDAARDVLKIRRVHEEGCDTGKGDDRECDCALSPIYYALAKLDEAPT